MKSKGNRRKLHTEVYNCQISPRNIAAIKAKDFLGAIRPTYMKKKRQLGGRNRDRKTILKMRGRQFM
jgi:hypothetical protein